MMIIRCGATDEARRSSRIADSVTSPTPVANVPQKRREYFDIYIYIYCTVAFFSRWLRRRQLFWPVVATAKSCAYPGRRNRTRVECADRGATIWILRTVLATTTTTTTNRTTTTIRTTTTVLVARCVRTAVSADGTRRRPRRRPVRVCRRHRRRRPPPPPPSRTSDDPSKRRRSSNHPCGARAGVYGARNDGTRWTFSRAPTLGAVYRRQTYT